MMILTPTFDESSYLAFLEANKDKDIEAVASYLHKDCVFIMNKHVFNRSSYLWLLRLTFPLIDYKFDIRNLIVLENRITCELMMDVTILQNSNHFLFGRILKNQYWKGLTRATYELKEGKIFNNQHRVTTHATINVAELIFALGLELIRC